MKTIGKNYLKRIRFFLLFLFLCILSFFVVFSLYRLPLESILYSLALCLVIGIFFFFVGFIHYKKRHKMLCEAKRKILITKDCLPEPADLIEADYLEMIRDLYTERFRLLKKKDKEFFEMLDYYTIWAHQIKTPIAALRLLLQSDTKNSSDLSAELFKIEQYVEMVLQYLRLGNMSQDLVLKTYDLEQIVKQAVRKYAKLFIQKNIKLDFRDVSCQIVTDEKWLLFVIEQILSNSLKYTQVGSIYIYLDKTKPKTLVIADTGIGIRKEDLNRVFERGFTGYNGRKDKRATGIGLYLCKRILTNLSHKIQIDSEPGKGTKVFLDFVQVQLHTE